MRYLSLFFLTILTTPLAGEKPESPKESCDHYGQLLRAAAEERYGSDSVVKENRDSVEVFCSLGMNLLKNSEGFSFTIIVPIEGKADKLWNGIIEDAQWSKEQYHNDETTNIWLVEKEMLHSRHYRNVMEVPSYQNYIQKDIWCRKIGNVVACIRTEGDPQKTDKDPISLDEPPYMPPDYWWDLFQDLK